MGSMPDSLWRCIYVRVEETVAMDGTTDNPMELSSAVASILAGTVGMEISRYKLHWDTKLHWYSYELRHFVSVIGAHGKMPIPPWLVLTWMLFGDPETHRRAEFRIGIVSDFRILPSYSFRDSPNRHPIRTSNGRIGIYRAPSPKQNVGVHRIPVKASYSPMKFIIEEIHPYRSS